MGPAASPGPGVMTRGLRTLAFTKQEACSNNLVAVSGSPSYPYMYDERSG